MNDETVSINPPTSFYWIAGIAFVWDLLGAGAYISAVTMSPEAIAALPDAEQALQEGAPAWATALFAIAVWGGVLGTLLLLLRKAWAFPVLVVSFAAVAINMGYTWFVTEAAEVYGAGQAVMAVLVFAIAAYLVWFAKDAKGKGWIS